jgi:N-methylhydantoinase A
MNHLGPGDELDGPAVIEGNDTTVVVPPTHGLHVDAFGHLILTEDH